MAFPVAPGVTSYSGTLIPEIWSSKTLVNFYQSTILSDVSNTDYQGEIKKYGDKVIIRGIPEINIDDWVKDQKLNYTQPTQPSNTELLIDKAKTWNFPISVVDLTQADIPFVNKWTADAAMRLKIAIERSVFAAIYTSAATYNKGATAGYISQDINLGASGSPLGITRANLIEVIVERCGLALDEYDIPAEERFVILPSWACALLKTGDLKDCSMTGDGKSTLRTGQIGMIDRFMIYSSNLLATGTDTATVYNAMFGSKIALTFATQLTDTETIPNPDTHGKLMRGLQIYGYKVVQPKALGHLYIKKG